MKQGSISGNAGEKNAGLCPGRWPRPGRWIRSGISLLAVELLCGCQVLSYSGLNGERFWRGALGGKTVIASMSFETGTNGLRRFELKGYQNDSNQALATVTEAAVRGAVQGVK